MTAINAQADRSGTYFMTDAACYDERNILQMWKSKVKTFPRLRLGMATSGTRGDGDSMVASLDMMTTYEEAIREFPDLLRDWHEDHDAPLMMLVGGWSEEKRCGEIFRIATHKYLGRPAFTMDRLSIAMNPPVDKLALQSAGISSADGKSLIEDPEELLTRLIRLQRHVKFPMPEEVGADVSPYCVGGVAELTVINASGIHQRTVLRWPDRLLNPIDPHAAVEGRPTLAEPSAAVLPAERKLSRQERRAMEAKQRKSA